MLMFQNDAAVHSWYFFNHPKAEIVKTKFNCEFADILGYKVESSFLTFHLVFVFCFPRFFPTAMGLRERCDSDSGVRGGVLAEIEFSCDMTPRENKFCDVHESRQNYWAIVTFSDNPWTVRIRLK